ncbi:MAG: hypothetical protein BWY83_00897 [bacterium ADurb.Bin478]|nr:MAG: hypothetical protein BWY83_00897 [bacterium ADurb.Bin478]
MLAAVEHEMFKEVGKTGAAGLFVFRAHMIPDVDRHDGGFMIFVDDQPQSVFENEFGEWYFNVALRPERKHKTEKADRGDREHDLGTQHDVSLLVISERAV